MGAKKYASKKGQTSVLNLQSSSDFVLISLVRRAMPNLNLMPEQCCVCGHWDREAAGCDGIGIGKCSLTNDTTAAQFACDQFEPKGYQAFRERMMEMALLDPSVCAHKWHSGFFGCWCEICGENDL